MLELVPRLYLVQPAQHVQITARAGFSGSHTLAQRMLVIQGAYDKARDQPAQIVFVRGKRGIIEIIDVVNDLPTDRAEGAEILRVEIAHDLTRCSRDRPSAERSVQHVARKQMESAAEENESRRRHLVQLGFQTERVEAAVELQNGIDYASHGARPLS